MIAQGKYMLVSVKYETLRPLCTDVDDEVHYFKFSLHEPLSQMA